MNKHFRLIVLILVFLLGLYGCSTAPMRDPAFAASYPPAYIEQPPTNGAIYQVGNNLVLFEDIKARRVGDTLTVRLVERTDASKSANTSSSRSTETTLPNPTVFGTQPQFGLPGVLPLAAAVNGNNLETNIAADTSFAGNGSSTQKNSLFGDITVTVADVLPNGNLVVKGEKRLNLNQGNEYVQISGIVRPVDIATDNSVVSTKIADATIIYNGDGQVAESNTMAWLARFFISAIFPF